jgi:Retinal pigment epithelial membrane protein
VWPALLLLALLKSHSRGAFRARGLGSIEYSLSGSWRRLLGRASLFSLPRSADAPEGDGWVVAVVYRGAEDRSDFVVFDAGAIQAGPIGVAKLPRRVPFGFHGNWRSA